MSTPRKILFVNHEVECGGAEHSLLELIEGLDRGRFEPHLVCSTEGPLADRARQLGAEVHFVPMLFRGKLRKLIGLVRAGMLIRGLIRHLGIQIVHTNSMIAGYCGIFAAKLCGVPSIWHVRDMGYPVPAKKLCTQAERVIANSWATARSLEFPARLEARIGVVYNGVAPEFFEQPDTRAAVREELALPADERLVAVFGRLDPWKGHDVLLRAGKRVLGSHPDTTFLVVGDVLFDGSRARHGSYRDELDALARELGIFGKVRFLGHRSDVPRLLAATDIVVHPSTEPEPFGRTIAEAHAAGRPVVGSAAGGIPEIIEDGENGYLVAPGDSVALADRVSDLLADPELARRLGAAGRAAAARRFLRSQHVAEIESIYDRV